MARRRQVAPLLPAVDPVPDRLRRFVVEDWVTPGEIPPYLPTTVNGKAPTAAYIAEARETLAWGRYRRALRLWQVEHATARRPPLRGAPAHD